MAAWNSIIYLCSKTLHSFLSLAHFRSHHRHPSAAQGHLHTFHPTKPWSAPYPPSAYFCRLHPSSQTALIHSLHVSKPFQYSDPLYSPIPSPIPARLCNCSFLTLPIRGTPTKLLKHFISSTFTFLLSEFLMPLASAPYNTVGTITPSYRHFFALIPNHLLHSTLSRAPYDLYPSFILCTTSLVENTYADAKFPNSSNSLSI